MLRIVGHFERGKTKRLKKENEGETSRGRAEWKRREEGSQAGSEGVGLVVTVKKGTMVRSTAKLRVRCLLQLRSLNPVKMYCSRSCTGFYVATKFGFGTNRHHCVRKYVFPMIDGQT